MFSPRTSSQPRRYQRSVWSILIGGSVAAAIFWYLFQTISFSEVVELLEGVDAKGVLVFFVFSISMSVFRMWRYALLLAISDYQPPKAALFLIVLVRNLFADLFPARIGTIIYIALVTTRLGIPVEVATSSWAYSYLFDILAICPLILLAAALSFNGSSFNAFSLGLVAIIFGVAIVALIFFLPQLFQIVERLWKQCPAFSKRLQEVGSRLIGQIGAEVARVKSAQVLIPVTILSLLIRITKYAGLYFFLLALLEPLGFTIASLPPVGVFLGICAAEFSAMLPASGIAGFGAYQGAWAIAFHFLGFPDYLAKLTSVTHHIFTQAYGYALGLVAWLFLLLPLWRGSHDALPKRLRTTRTFYLGLSFAVAIIFFLSASAYKVGDLITSRPTDRHAQVQWSSETEHSDPPPLSAVELPGQILFDSNRSGTFGIYVIDAKTRQVRPLVDTQLHETQPSPSDDGKYIAYASGPSPHRLASTDIWIVDSKERNSQRVVHNGSYPSFSSDSSKLYFLRERRQVIIYDREKNSETLLFPTAQDQGWSGAVVTPRISPDGKWLSFTSDSPSRWHVWVVELESRQRYNVGQGCQGFWATTRPVLYYVSTAQMLDGSGIREFDRLTHLSKVVVDLDAPRGHEYFPSLGDSDRFLFWSASTSADHSHIDGNYQLFIRVLETKNTTQFTADPYTNRWPSLLRNLT